LIRRAPLPRRRGRSGGRRSCGAAVDLEGAAPAALLLGPGRRTPAQAPEDRRPPRSRHRPHFEVRRRWSGRRRSV